MIVKYYKQGTSVGNTLSFNTDDLRGICQRIFVKPPATSTTYNFKLTDDNSLDIYYQKGVRGTLNDLSIQALKGIYTVTIDNTSADGIFTLQIEYEEIA